ncbi:MAG TPA: hypothetical protein VJ385_06195, partial [Fibrobacteria bacterium]|nr:hypothetical protein [Fibrobacteria bacterium]
MAGSPPSRRPPRWRRAGRLVPAGALMGLFVIGADDYFGTGDGAFGFRILGVFLLAGLLSGFALALDPLRHPRRLDSLFVSAATRARRKSIVYRNTLENALTQPVLPCLALLVICIAKGYGPGPIAGLLGIFLLESALVSGMLAAVIRWGLIPVSRKAFPGDGASSFAFGGGSDAVFIAATFSVSRLLSGWLPGPYAWIVRRKLIYLLRADAVSVLIYLCLVLALGTAFSVHWNPLGAAVFTVAGTMLSLTLVQIALAESEAHYRTCSYFLPGEWLNYRSNLALYLAVALPFPAFFGVSAAFHGDAALSRLSGGFLQISVTCIAFPFLLMAEA